MQCVYIEYIDSALFTEGEFDLTVLSSIYNCWINIHQNSILMDIAFNILDAALLKSAGKKC